MAKKLGKLFTLAVTAGTAAAAAYYYLQNKKAAVQEAPEEEDDFEKIQRMTLTTPISRTMISSMKASIRRKPKKKQKKTLPSFLPKRKRTGIPM